MRSAFSLGEPHVAVSGGPDFPAEEGLGDDGPTCPVCQSGDVYSFPYYDADPDTGYSDSGVRGKCNGCGFSGVAEDFE